MAASAHAYKAELIYCLCHVLVTWFEFALISHRKLKHFLLLCFDGVGGVAIVVRLPVLAG